MKQLLLGIILIVACGVLSTAHANVKKIAIKGAHSNAQDRSEKKLVSVGAKITNFRRHEMRAISGHYRSMEAVIKL